MADFLDLTTAVETDTAGRLTVSPDTIAVDGLTRSDRSNVAFDYGVGYFNGNFTHRHYVDWASGTDSGSVFSWALTNTPNTAWTGIGEGGIVGSNLDGISFRHNLSTDYYWTLFESDAGAQYAVSFLDSGGDAPRYIEIYRDESTLGPNGGGYLYADIYSDDTYSTLVGSVQLNLHNLYDFRYLYPMMPRDDNNAFNWTGTVGKVYFLSEQIGSIVIPRIVGSRLKDALAMSLLPDIVRPWLVGTPKVSP
ncbi:MAG: hypothetical protein KAR06_04340 [Deltaproteobacteria bacterium]|nr:hypothetical protein [Deltaproteobacteria bacterium]